MTSDQVYLIILRFCHIFFGVFWAGVILYLPVFLMPAINASGAEGSKVMQQLARTNRFPVVMTLVGLISIVAGFLLLKEWSNGFENSRMSSSEGRALSLGGGLAIIAYLIGFFINRPTVTKIARLGQAIAKQGSPPSAEQMQQMTSLRSRLANATKIIAVLVAITVIAMALARYL